jgi:glycosyltransferase involved in cell wall biosynthesis
MTRSPNEPLVAAAKTGVLFIDSSTKPGADTWIHHQLIRCLDRSRYDVHVACEPGPAGEPTATYQSLRSIPELTIREARFASSVFGRPKLEKALRMVWQGPQMLGGLVGLAAYVRRNHIRILHSTERPRDAVSCMLVSWMSGARSVIHIHVGGDWMSAPVRFAMHRADALIGVSNFVVRTLRHDGYRAERAHAVLNAIDVGTWDSGMDRLQSRRELGVPEGAPLIVSIARLFHWKGQGDLLEALAIVRKEFPTVRLLVVGEDYPAGDPQRGSYLAELQERVEAMGLKDNVAFLGFRSDVSRLLSAADVFALPSFQEPFGLVFAEAMAMKRPVVALDSGGTSEVVENGKTGLLSPARDLQALAKNLMTLLRDPALRAQMGEAGRQRVEANFTAARMARDAERVYDSLL